MTAALGHQCCIFLLHSDRNQYRYTIEFRRTCCGQPRGSFRLLRKGFDMTEKATRPRRLVQLELPPETVEASTGWPALKLFGVYAVLESPHEAV